MAISRPCYASREIVKRALDVRETARADAQVDRALEAASDDLDGGTRRIAGMLHRRFYPELRTMTFDWPDEQGARPWRLWLDQHELIEVTSITAAGTALQAGEYMLRPDDGPPFTHVEINLATSAAFDSGATSQRAISITGLYGYSDDETPAGALAGPVDDSTTSVDVTDAAPVGVGDVIRVGDERMLVTGRVMLDTGQDITADLAATQAATSVGVSDGTAYNVDEVILLDGERMLIVDVAGDNLIVKRGWDGSTLAAHDTGADVYAARTLTVARGALGTTAAAHSGSAAIWRHVPPAGVRDLCVAEALNQLLQETSGYAREVGSGDNAREMTGRGMREIRAQVSAAYGRNMRIRAV